MSCPYFIPTERLELGFVHPDRLPLGGAWSGLCGAPGHSSVRPSDEELRDCCNLGHAQCRRLPESRTADAIRFVAKPREDGRLSVHYVFERQCLPAGQGVLEYDLRSGTWICDSADEKLRRQAECFLSAWRSRNFSPEAASTS